jgi:putative ABC transport system permease protein
VSVEPYIASFGNFTKPTGGNELCYVLGSQLDDGTAGAAGVLTREMREALAMPFAVVVDESDLGRLALDKESDGVPKINGKRVHVVGTVKGLKSLAAPWVFCSLHTARQILGPMLPADHVTYFLARCDAPGRAREVVAGLREQYGADMVAYTAEEFSFQSRWYWLTRTKAGLAIGYAAFLGLLVGLVITAQTLYSATAASAKEFAILLALGIPRWRISLMVLGQSFWVGVIGIGFALPFCLGLRALGAQFAIDVDLRWEVLAGTAAITVGMALLAGTLALRSVRQIEPMSLLR